MADRMTPEEMRRILDATGVSQRGAAARLAVNKSTIYRWLTGKRRIPRLAAKVMRRWRKYGN